jgi:predicted Fe-S protein YdhL (DUF1289 family)
MAELRGNCTDYVTWLEYELGDRKAAFAILDGIIYSQRYGGAKRLCANCPVMKRCFKRADNIGWWGSLSPRERREVSARLTLAALAQEQAQLQSEAQVRESLALPA